MTGRPSTYNREIADEILLLISMGKSLRSICKSDDRFPPQTTFRQWVLDDVDGLSARSARAYRHGYDAIAEETIEIADDASNDWMADNDPDNPGYKLNGEAVQRAKVRIDTRLRLLGKWDAKRYGDKVHQEVTGPDGAPLCPIDVGALSSEAIREILSARTKP